MPRTDFSIKEGDTQPAIEATLLYDDAPVDLTDAVVVFDMKHTFEDVSVRGMCTIQDTDGKVAYIWDETDTNVPGTYEAEFLVDYDLPETLSEFEKEETFPPDRLLRIEINEGI